MIVINGRVNIPKEWVNFFTLERWKKECLVRLVPGPRQKIAPVVDMLIDDGSIISLPRAYRDEVVEMFGEDKIQYDVVLNPMEVESVIQPRDYQIEAVEVMCNRLQSGLGTQAMLCAGTGIGKAQPLDEPVLTPNGWRKIGDLRVGDLVIGRSGKPVAVTGVFPQGERDIYRVTMTDGSSTRACGEHLWHLEGKYRSGRTAGKQNTIKVVRTDELMEYSDKGWKVPCIATPIDGVDAGLLLRPYSLGALLGDGGMSQNRVILSTADPFILDRVLQETGWSVRHLGGYDYLLGNKQGLTVKTMCALGLAGKRSFEKHIPVQYMKASWQSRLELLRGLLDTDGSATNAGGFEFTTTSKVMCDQVRELVWSLGGNASIKSRVTSYTYKGVKKFGRISYRLHGHLPSHFCPFSLPRKADEWLGHVSSAKAWRPKRKVQSVEPCGRAQCICISVDASDHLYVTKDYIVTHNTVMALFIAGQLKQKTLVVVHMTALVNQWMERISVTVGGNLPGVFPGVKVGLFNGKKKQFGNDYDFVIATVHTLSNLEPDHPIFSWPGLVIADEAHRIGAMTWNKAIHHFKSAYRIGCTATPRRSDRGERLFFGSLGKIEWSKYMTLMSPSVRAVGTNLYMLGEQLPEHIKDRQIALNLERNILIIKELKKAIGAGRKVLLVVKSIDHALLLWGMALKNLPEGAVVGACTGRWFHSPDDAYHRLTRKDDFLERFKKDGKFDESLIDLSIHVPVRKQPKKGQELGDIYDVKPKSLTIKDEDFWHRARTSDVVISTKKKVEEGFDVPHLDTLFIAAPLWDCEQLVGRILRPFEGKKDPVVAHFVDINTPKLVRAWLACKEKYLDLKGRVKEDFDV